MSKPSPLPILGLLAKFPDPGKVKTRLAAQTSPEWAARVAAAFLADMVERLSLVNARRVLAYAPAERKPYFANLAAGRFDLTLQGEGDLGKRMATFFAQQLRNGAERIVLLGADSPSLPMAFVDQAFRELAYADVVLGPAADGGYYLVGCGRRLPPIFEGISWGSASVLAETIARLPKEGWRLALLPPWYDVDTLADWQMLQGHLAAQRRAGVDPGLPHVGDLDSHGSPHPNATS